MQQISYHPEHTADTLRKKIDFFPCLQDGKFCGRKHTACNELQTVFFFLFFLRKQLADCLFNGFDKPDKNQHIADIETGMESRQFKGYGYTAGLIDIHKVGNNPVNHAQERFEQQQYPDHTEDIEHQVSHRCPAGLCVGRKRCQIGRNGCSDILSQYQCRTQFKTDPAIGTHDQRNSHRSGRSLYNHGQNGTDQNEKQDGEISHIRIVLDKSQHIRICTQVGCIGLQQIQTHE